MEGIESEAAKDAENVEIKGEGGKFLKLTSNNL